MSIHPELSLKLLNLSYLLANKVTSPTETSCSPRIIAFQLHFLAPVILPVQSYSCNKAIASEENSFFATPCWLAIF